ncbi:MAG: 4-phosphoerythronate dehydrogenase [Rikenellaceae bacterium]|nr:4-phosphoerythronate dehydrogenase [Rikenellaceae bacterium]
MTIVADRDIPYLQGVMEPFARVVYLDGRSIAPADVRGADGLVVRTRTRCDGALLTGSAVKVIATATIGYDHIDREWCRAHGIEVATSAGCNAHAVLQWLGAVLRELTLTGRIAGPGGTTVGVVGAGNVGSLVARYAALWGFKVLCCDPPRERAATAGKPDGLWAPERFHTFDEVARAADLITFHIPLTTSGPEATLRMAGPQFFAGLRPGAVVFNSSRGEVLDSAALLAADCGCVIDTWDPEPAIDPALAAKALLATPHIAGYSIQGKAMGSAMAVRALAKRFGWLLTDWYPEQTGPQTVPADITWDEMCRRIPAYFDIAALSAELKREPGSFEAMRNGYRYRQEFF